MKREEEERQRHKNEAPLNLPPDHPVRKLFQRFRQQKEARLTTAVGGDGDVERGSLYAEAPLANTAITAPSVVTVTESPPTPSPSPSASPSPSTPTSTPPTAAATDSKAKLQVPAPVSLVGGGGASKMKGWGRFRESLAPKQPDGWPKVSKAESMETLPERSKAARVDETPAPALLKKTDSCDSGITKSDLRLDRAGELRLTPHERSPVQPPDGRHSFYPIPEQTLQASLQEIKLELRDELRGLAARVSGLEVQLAEALRLLSRPRKSPGSPPPPPPLFDLSRPTSPEQDKEEDIFS